ncbi:serine-enriched protein-like [Mytilus trossulus]|uniref:serine-enriched protein-like n=1 Tax=Mytilus trossulus TaxID=6551 RepID=UPI00300421C6
MYTILNFVSDYSSGYESGSGSSDGEYKDISSAKSTTFATLDKIWNEQHQQSTKEKMNFQNTMDLSSHLRYIISMPELCDVTFLIGSQKVPVYGVKAIMGTRSRVLYNIILKKQRELEFSAKNPKVQTKKKFKTPKTNHHLTIPVSKYLLEDFQKIVEYLHCGTVDISASNVAGLLCGASQFELGDLRTACLDYIEHCSRIGSISLLIPSAKRYSHHSSGKTLISVIIAASKRTTVV